MVVVAVVVVVEVAVGISSRMCIIILLSITSDNAVCPDGYFKCPDSYCISLHNICDGKQHCSNGEDEQDCGMIKCISQRNNVLQTQFN